MRSIVLICLAIAVVTPAAAATLYRWVDENGRVHYSDRPQQGAETVEVAPAQTYEPAPAAPSSQPAPAQPAEPATAEAAPGYSNVSIASPTQDQVLWNIGSVLSVTVALEPALQPDHRIVVRYNGTPVDSWPPRSTAAQVENVFRGTHTVSAEVVDASGQVVAASEPITFYVKQTSILLN